MKIMKFIFYIAMYEFGAQLNFVFLKSCCSNLSITNMMMEVVVFTFLWINILIKFY